MDNTQEIKYSVIIRNNPDDETLNLLNRYWLFEKGHFLNKPKKLAAEKKIRIRELFDIIKEYSHSILTINCKNCINLVERNVNSQSSFAELVRNKPLCKACEAIRKKENDEANKRILEIWKQEQEQQEKNNQSILRFYEAIQRFEETRFDNNEARFILNFIKNHGNIVSWAYYIENYSIYNKFKLLGLLEIEENTIDKYVTITYPEQLEGLLSELLKTEASTNEPKDSNPWSRLSFHLEKNKSYRNSNTPRFSGTIIFKEDIVIKKGTKCLYGVWDRDHDDAWLTLTPTSDIIVAKNKPIHKEPEHIRDLLNRFLDNPENRDY
ncbi:hypothetical protein [Maribacter sp. 1_2014MBL_MicDiv]|uniref:hypothetical protein n=1 Tax=Maribacter sp. 1_2014MBL_MicDiv TaxID=1644130 RepID=UPI0008F4F38E|nr:hypothetical protein [Maribacter sp. 1_2014MBL_MicDiv]APA64257.1 hypothetical protein YQ22_07940 [Maribacter sp. 1_2014MBL_MicDiv]